MLVKAALVFEGQGFRLSMNSWKMNGVKGCHIVLTYSNSPNTINWESAGFQNHRKQLLAQIQKIDKGSL